MQNIHKSKLKIKNKKSDRQHQLIVEILIILLYLSITNCFYLFPAKYFSIPKVGKLYDLIFLIVLLLYYSINNGKIHICFNRKIAILFWSVMVYVILQAVISLQYQSIFNAIRTLREIMYIFVVWIFCFFRYDKTIILKKLIYLDLISSVLFCMQFLIQKPILQSHYTYMPLGGITLLRSYAEVPVFSMFFIPYLIIRQIKKKYMFGKLKDLVILIVFIIAEAFKLGRGIWITEIVIVMISILISNKNIIDIKKISAIICVILCIFYIIPNFAPSFVYQFQKGIEDLENTSGNVEVRNIVFNNRIDYLKKNHKLLLGIGGANADYILPGIGINGNDDVVKNIDNSYSTIIIRYGLIGVILIIILLYNIAIIAFKYESIEGKALSMMILFIIINASNGPYLIEDYFLKIGIIIGIVFKKNIVINRRKTIQVEI